MADAAVVPQGKATGAFPWWAILIQGIAALVIGLLLMARPATTTVALVYFIGWWWLISGIFELGTLFVDRTAWGWRVFSGVLGIFAGGYIIAAPLIGAVVVVGVATLMLGINGMIIGVVDIIKGFQGAGWGKTALGVLSFLLGAVIAFNFTSFMTALPWVWGLFAIIFGVAAIAMSFQAKKAQA
jgi:uncharacterized membrane protein HdeD (DUF308 family)